jgi:hypothetical protein
METKIEVARIELIYITKNKKLSKPESIKVKEINKMLDESHDALCDIDAGYCDCYEQHSYNCESCISMLEKHMTQQYDFACQEINKLKYTLACKEIDELKTQMTRIGTDSTIVS